MVNYRETCKVVVLVSGQGGCPIREHSLFFFSDLEHPTWNFRLRFALISTMSALTFKKLVPQSIYL